MGLEKKPSKTMITASAFALLFVILLPFFTKQIQILGYHKSVSPNFHPGTCRRITGIEDGAADMELLPGGKVLVSSGRRWPMETPATASSKGKIILLDLNQKKVKPIPVKIKGKNFDKINFQPTGLSKWISKKSGKITIFVVNNMETIERFIYSEKDNVLVHAETITPERNALQIEDVAAVSDSMFYLSNHFGSMPSLEYSLLLAWANIAFYDGQNTTLIDDQLLLPKGISTSADGKYLYVNGFGDQVMYTYKINSDYSVDWYNKKEHKLGYLGDRMYVDETGEIWSTGHSIGKDALSHLNINPYLISSSTVVRMRIQDGIVTSTFDVFADDGNLISGATISIHYKKRLLVGSSRNYAVLCDGVKV